MYDETPIPPLRDLPPGRLDAVKRHLFTEITRDAHPQRRLIFARVPRRLALISVGAALALGGTAALVVATTQAPRSQPSASSRSHPAVPPGFQPLALSFASGTQGVSTINVTVNSATANASLQIQVLRSDASQPLEAIQQSPADQQVVYQEQTPMTSIPSPASGALGTVALSTWSGVLSPTGWTGGCQNALYQVVAEIAAPSGSYSSFAAPAETYKGQWFTCSSGSVG